MTDMPFFIADNPALDFLNSIAQPSDEVIDWLSDGHRFVEWLRLSAMIPDDQADRFQAMPQEALEDVTEQARVLREWLRGVVARNAGRDQASLTEGEARYLNGLLARDQRYFQVHADPCHLHETRDWSDPMSLLMPIAAAAAHLLAEADIWHVKNCEGPTCTMWFEDKTKNRKRRWCTMAICGNRAKAAAFRARKKAQA